MRNAVWAHVSTAQMLHGCIVKTTSRFSHAILGLLTWKWTSTVSLYYFRCWSVSSSSCTTTCSGSGLGHAANEQPNSSTDKCLRNIISEFLLFCTLKVLTQAAFSRCLSPPRHYCTRTLLSINISCLAKTLSSSATRDPDAHCYLKKGKRGGGYASPNCELVARPRVSSRTALGPPG